MTRNPRVGAIVDALVGTWVGHGRGRYPTIEPFEYRELTRFTQRPDHPALHYQQRSWPSAPEGEVVSHWETGLMRISSDGTVILHNAQSGRTESMAGTWDEHSDGWGIELNGIGYAGDARVIASTRALRLSGSGLEYELYMETTSTQEMLLHLSATLHRRD